VESREIPGGELETAAPWLGGGLLSSEETAALAAVASAEAAPCVAGVGDGAWGLSSESDVLPPVAGMGGTVFSFARRTSVPSDAGFFGSRATSSIRFHASA
jgi:hypothetical protein